MRQPVTDQRKADNWSRVHIRLGDRNVLYAFRQLSPDCGGLNNLAGRAWCVTAPLGQVGALADAYIADLATKNWLAAGGDENRVVFIKRREAGGCDGMQMVAFYDTARVAVAELPAYLGFATIPGDVCAAQTAAEKPASDTSTQ